MTARQVSVLLADDDDSFRRVQEYSLEQAGYEVTACAGGSEALDRFREKLHDLVVTDIRMPGLDGLELLERLKAISPDTPVVIITGHGTIETAVEAMKRGAFDFLTKPFPGDQLRLTLQRALQFARLQRENLELRRVVEDRFAIKNMVGSSPAMKKLAEAISLAAPSDSTVLISGETGTGKELVARAIHFNSKRRDNPLVVVNCGALPANLVEAELFGYRKGAFTGADSDRPGKFESADGGTLFLDEIGEIPLDLQPKILRVLQSGEVDRIGENSPVRVDVRIVAATHRDLDRLVKEEKFRKDLYYRLAVIPLRIPPLRERREDIPLLAEHLLGKMKKSTGRSGLRLPAEALTLFDRYAWPGNVRELENVIERMVVLSREDLLSMAHLPDELLDNNETALGSMALPARGVVLDDLEKELISQALQRTGGNRTRAAGLLGLTRNTLLYRMKKHGLR